MSDNKIYQQNKDTISVVSQKQDNIFKRFLDWIAKGAKKAAEAGASCGS
ncbi:MAG: hypothetical protein HQK73_09610 [Desulfamplus sp.]|nr:hypothetical protein [Desulfamplus sp.]MBF0412722.1 hypothetical protein [Desulfamplus sp.]